MQHSELRHWMLSVVYTDCLTFIVMLGVVMLSVVMLSVAMLSIVDTFQTGLKTASRARLLALPTNMRLFWKGLPGTSTLYYYEY